MAVFVWIFIGLIIGSLTGRRLHHTRTVLMMDVALGIAGGLVGGFVFSSLGSQQTIALVVISSLGAVVGSVATLVGYRTVFRAM